MRTGTKILLCLGVLACGLGFRAGLPGLEPVLPTRPVLDPTVAVGVVMNESWSLWRTQEMTGNRQRHDQRSVHTRYYRQRAGADVAEMVYESFQQQAPQPGGVLSDGTVVMTTPNRRELLLVDRRGHERTVDLDLPGGSGPQVFLHGVYDEGLFVQPGPQPGRHNRQAPLYFVPFRSGQLDVASALALTEEREGAGFRPRRPVVRAWPRVAWADEQALFVFDLISLEVQTVAFEGGQLERGFDEVRGFDGRFIALRKLIIDTEAGRVVGKQNDNQPITIRDGVMYELEVRREGNGRNNLMALVARDLMIAPNKTIELSRFNAYDMYWSYGSRRQPSPNVGPTIVQPTDQGLLIFDGEAWITVPYYQRDPAEPR